MEDDATKNKLLDLEEPRVYQASYPGGQNGNPSLDGELVAIDGHGRPDFNLLQNFRAEAARIHYYVFDLLCWKGRDLRWTPTLVPAAVFPLPLRGELPQNRARTTALSAL